MDLKSSPFVPNDNIPKGSFTFAEFHGSGTGLFFSVKKVLFYEKSKFQEIQIVETEEYGKMLILDGAVQTTERDEFIYHEMLVHVPMFSHPEPKNILVIGGGDGGCVREIFKHKSVEKVTMVEIDKMVVDSAMKFLPSISSELGHPKLDLRIEDAVKFVRRSSLSFDVIIVDSTDPVGFASPLTTESFFRSSKRILKENGIYAAQTQGPFFESKSMGIISKKIRKIFPRTSFYLANTPTYPGGMWSFAVSCKNSKSDFKIHPRILKRKDLKYYSNEIHYASFALPPYVKRILGEK
tara:strand:- start:389 stop:1273 length:885 start_codon:yes stop_codon:yes gene_type:complete